MAGAPLAIRRRFGGDAPAVAGRPGRPFAIGIETMPLRLLEFTIPSDEVEELSALVGDHPVRHTSTWPSEDGGATVHILLEAEQVEGLTDALLGRFGARDDFRLVLLAVEATLPQPEEPAPESPAFNAQEESNEATGQRISREELYADIVEASRLTPVYTVLVALSTVVAALGLIRGDVAIIIGAMVIAPLLGPNVALSLACTLGDLELAGRSLKANGVGVAVAGALSFILGMTLAFDPEGAQIAARTGAGIGDVALALAAGAAGSLAFTSGIPAALVGVMVAVALLPPLVTAGLLAGAGFWGRAGGALMLLVTNVACVNLAAVATFLIQRIRPVTWWEAERARKATRIAASTWIFTLLVLLGVMILGRA